MVIRHYPIYTPLYMWYLSISRFEFGCFFLNISPCDFLLCIAFLIELVAAHTSLYVNCAYRHNADIRIHMYVQVFTYVYPSSTYFTSLLSHRLMEYICKKAAAWAFRMQSVLLPDESPSAHTYVHTSTYTNRYRYIDIVATLTGPSLEYDRKEIQFPVLPTSQAEPAQ